MQTSVTSDGRDSPCPVTHMSLTLVTQFPGVISRLQELVLFLGVQDPAMTMGLGQPQVARGKHWAKFRPQRMPGVFPEHHRLSLDT